MSAPDVWFMTTGEAGYRTQARGLARALSPAAREWVVDLRPPWRWLPGAWAPFALAGLDPARERPAPPWPDVLVTCGRRATAPSIAIRRASRGRTLTVHVQNPLTSLSAFDLVVVMAHDRVAGPNVVCVSTALHDVTPERLAAAAGVWRQRLAADHAPLVGVLLGGSTRSGSFDVGKADQLIDRLARLRQASGARLAITPSRRTPQAVILRLQHRLGGEEGVFLWDGEGENPYLGILALSSRLVVTADSVSMISEALATGAGVDVFGAGGGRRQNAFVDGLVTQGLVRRFEGEAPLQPARAPIDSTGIAAQAVRRLLMERTGVSG